MGYIEDVYQYEDQISTLWDLKIIPPKGFGIDSEKLQYKIQDCNIPFLNLKAERMYDYNIMWTGIEDLQNLSFTIRESNDFSSLMFFETLIDKIYDYKNRVFRVLKSQSDSLIDIEISFGKRDDLKNITLDSLLLKDEKSISILFKRNTKRIVVCEIDDCDWNNS